MKHALLIELGPILKLHQRIVNGDSPRSVALAKRTFERSTINPAKILELAQVNDVECFNNSLSTIIALQGSSPLNTPEFVQAVETLLTLV